MSRKKSNKNISKNHIPISESFCNSVIKGGNKDTIKNDLINDPKNKQITLFNSDKSAHISRVYEGDGVTVTGFKVVTRDYDHTIRCGQHMLDMVVEMLHFGFTYSQIKSLLNITHKQYDILKPKDFSSMNDFISILTLVPMSYIRCNDILHYIKDIPRQIVEHPSYGGLATALGVTNNQAKKIYEFYNSKTYSHLVSAARKKIYEEQKAEKENNKNTVKKAVAPIEDKKVVDEKVVVFSTETSTEPIIESNQGVEVVAPVVEESVIEESVVEESVDVCEPTVDESLVVEEEVLKDDLDNIETSEEIEDTFSEIDTDKVEVVQKKRTPRAEVTMEDYQTLLGFAGLPFDFDILERDLKEGLKTSTFTEYVENSNKAGISNLLYPLMYMRSSYTYSAPFYPAEDKILEQYYKDIGNKVVEVMEEVIPNYNRRSDYEYLLRIREKGYKTSHPEIAFTMFPEDISLVNALFSKVKKSPSKYFFWLDTFDILYLAEKYGLGENTSKKVKKPIDIDSIDLKPYTDSALKLKEVMYHNEFWTSEKHDLFKEEFKLNGLSVTSLIDGLTEEECLEHARVYKINQNYTTKEVAEMREVYMEGGLEALLEKFSYRTESALKFKVEEQNWEEERNKILLEAEIEKRVAERIEDEKKKLTETLREVVLQEELQNYRESLIKEITPEVRKSIGDTLSVAVKGTVMQEIKFEMPDMVRKSALKDLPNILPQKIVSKLDGLIRKELDKIS